MTVCGGTFIQFTPQCLCFYNSTKVLISIELLLQEQQVIGIPQPVRPISNVGPRPVLVDKIHPLAEKARRAREARLIISIISVKSGDPNESEEGAALELSGVWASPLPMMGCWGWSNWAGPNSRFVQLWFELAAWMRSTSRGIQR
ncbi:glutamate-1-semialdehyde-2 1-aminomutase [Striga asiatica]|uniref:Glutamate-1-semialdehyde-2 1-aminomutase n=1 Tax=Striga asiatica TaxID=4170 RepID=A0A5A7R665_STRAF|nr:glutamate-1-semialdehyde-2 1-aminomutase [Striga asiatica]